MKPLQTGQARAFGLSQALESLTSTPSVLDAWLRGTDPSWHAVNEGPDTWSARDVVAHLIHGDETDWVARARIILDHGEAKPFEPFDRFGHVERYADWPMDALLDRFAEVRSRKVATVREWRLTDAQLTLRGRHPDFGPVTLGQLLATWAVHDLNHIGQIARVMARPHTEAVGPWRAYLSILR